MTVRLQFLRTLVAVLVIGVAACGDGGGITVTPGVTGLRFVIEPIDVLPSATFQVSVELVNSSQTRVSSASDVVTLSVSGGATLNGDVSVSASNGLASFNGLSISDPASGVRITASAAGHSVQSESFSVLQACQLFVGSLAAGQTVNGQIQDSDCQLDALYPQLVPSYVDRWELNLSSTTSLRLDLTSGGFDAFLFIADDQGNIIGFNDNTGATGDSNARVAQTFPAGDYVVLATTNFEGETGSYQLQVAQVDACEAASAFIFPGQSRTGSLDSGDCLDTPGRLLDYWYLSLTELTTLQVTLEAGAGAGFSMPLVGSDIVGGGHQISGRSGDGSVTLEHLFPAGDYWLFATYNEINPGSAPTGPYSLETTNPLAEPQVGCFDGEGGPTVVVPGSSATANIAADDCDIDAGDPRGFDHYQFFLLDGETLSTTMTADFEAQFQVGSVPADTEVMNNVPAGASRTIEVTADGAAFYDVFIVVENDNDTGEYDVSFSGGPAPAAPTTGADTGTLYESLRQYLAR